MTIGAVMVTYSLGESNSLCSYAHSVSHMVYVKRLMDLAQRPG